MFLDFQATILPSCIQLLNYGSIVKITICTFNTILGS
jgi:hypothetical protein